MQPNKYRPEDGDRPHFARPSFNETFSIKMFPDRRQAVQYLKKTTGYYMQAQDWAKLGKLWPAD